MTVCHTADMLKYELETDKQGSLNISHSYSVVDDGKVPQFFCSTKGGSARF